MTRKLLFLLLFTSAVTFGQSIIFEYDIAGNQTKRTFSVSGRMSSENVKPIKDLKENDFQKFFDGDVISYYPNPVKDELYLKWEVIDKNNIQQIDLVNVNGQTIKTFTKFYSENSFNISFSELTSGVYFVNLNYANGEQKQIKIIKQ